MAAPINQLWTGWLTRPMRNERKGITGQRWRAGFDDAGFRKADGRQKVPVEAGIKTLGVVLFLSLAGLSSPQRAQAQTTINICDRTPQIEAKILEALGKTEADCGSVTAAELAGITILEAENDKSLTALTAGDFDDLTGLIKLQLRGNNLSSLPSGVFDSLTSLEWLNLRFNPGVSNLPSATWQGLFTNLTTIKRLVAAPPSSLPSTAFNNLTNLELLWLNNGNLSSLPTGIFDKLTKLRWLQLQNNNLSSLPTGIFDKLTNLDQWLDLSGNGLRCLPPSPFITYPTGGQMILVPSIWHPTISTYRRCGVSIMESDGSTQVSEAVGEANTDTYTVTLNSRPRASATITVTSDDTGAATVSPPPP